MPSKKIASEHQLRDYVSHSVVGMVAALLRAFDVDLHDPDAEIDAPRLAVLRERVEALADDLAEQALEVARYRGVDVAAQLAPRRRATRAARRPRIVVEVAEQAEPVDAATAN